MSTKIRKGLLCRELITNRFMLFTELGFLQKYLEIV